MVEGSYKQKLLGLLAEKHPPNLSAAINRAIQNLSPSELAQVYVDAAFLMSAIQFIQEERWLQFQKSAPEISLGHFVKTLFQAELAPVFFLQEFFEASSFDDLKQARKNAAHMEKAVIQFAKIKSPEEQKTFARTSLSLMSELFESEHQMTLEKQELGLHLGLSLYRSFDMLDEVFNLNYQADHGMRSALDNTERLYEGAGVGVQSGYSSALMALRHLNPPPGSRLIDLGAGYGRIGLVVGLMRPDIDFLGYEYVPHRVDIARAASLNLGLDQHVHFHTQDLSSVEFQIPEADTYYIYDSFSESTYRHVLAQLVETGRKKRIAIVTKGNARKWMESPEQKGNWSSPQELDGGNICFFRSSGEERPQASAF